MYVFNVKSCKESHKDKKGMKKVVTGLVSVPVSLISCEMAWAIACEYALSSCQSSFSFISNFSYIHNHCTGYLG